MTLAQYKRLKVGDRVRIKKGMKVDNKYGLLLLSGMYGFLCSRDIHIIEYMIIGESAVLCDSLFTYHRKMLMPMKEEKS